MPETKVLPPGALASAFFRRQLVSSPAETVIEKNNSQTVTDQEAEVSLGSVLFAANQLLMWMNKFKEDISGVVCVCENDSFLQEMY